MESFPIEHWKAFAKKCKKDAFTLIELLVVVAIIGILASILLPVLGRAKESARMVSCMNNLKQLGIACGSYTLDNRGRMPDFRQWLEVKTTDIATGTLFPYLKCKPVYFCPSDKVPGAPKGTLTTKLRDYSYAMNCVICHDNDTAKCLKPTKTLLFGEADLPWNDFTGMVGPKGWMGSVAAFSTRHKERGHLMFCDLHVERLKAPSIRQLERSKSFWLPCPTTDSITISITSGLPDP